MNTNASGLNKQELQVVEAFSNVTVPEDIFKSCNIKGLISGMLSSQQSVESSAQKLERARRAKKDGNALTNWWNDRNDNIQDAQIDLSTSIGNLTQKSSQLLIINTAISKVLNNQQQILLQQQNLLEQQADGLANQNSDILSVQKTQEKQQREIIAANKGLLEAKGLTLEQAQKLIGCVDRVTDAEKRFALANQALLDRVEQRLYEASEQYSIELRDGFKNQSDRYAALEKLLADQLSVHVDETRGKLDGLSEAISEFSVNLELKLEESVNTAIEKETARDEATHQLKQDLAHRLKDQDDCIASVDQKIQGVHESVNVIGGRQISFQEDQSKVLQVQRDSLKSDLQRVAGQIEGQENSLTKTDAQLLVLKNVQQQNAKSNRLALVAISILALSSLVWQIAQYFKFI